MVKYDCALIIDEDPISNFVTVMTLGKINMVKEIKTSRNIQNSIDRIKENYEGCPELIILDLLNHEQELLSFIEVFNDINFKYKEKIKLVLLTSASARGIEKAERFGYPYIKKPITEDKLIALL